MTAILPAGVSGMLVRYAVDCERYARLFRGANCTAQATEYEREARKARDAVACHDEALKQRAAMPTLDDYRAAFAAGVAMADADHVDLRGAFR
jgi:hypothetical protein